MKTKKNIFYILITLYAVFLFILFFYPFFCSKPIHALDSNYSLVFLFSAIGISLIPFAEKIKIINFLEFERLKEKVKKVEKTQFLGEVLQTENKDLFYYDEDGLHKIPDDDTANFLKSQKGILQLKNSKFKTLKLSLPIESVETGKLLKYQEAIFIILNNKKYYITSWSYIIDWKRSEEKIDVVNLEYIRKYETAR